MCLLLLLCLQLSRVEFVHARSFIHRDIKPGTAFPSHATPSLYCMLAAGWGLVMSGAVEAARELVLTSQAPGFDLLDGTALLLISLCTFDCAVSCCALSLCTTDNFLMGLGKKANQVCHDAAGRGGLADGHSSSRLNSSSALAAAPGGLGQQMARLMQPPADTTQQLRWHCQF